MTAAEYTAALARVEKENPAEALLPLLRKGHSPGNCIFMRAALRRLAPAAPVQPPKQRPAATPAPAKHDTEAAPAPASTAAHGDTWAALTADIRRAYNHIRSLRNGYFSCKTDEARAAIAAQVLRAWEDTRAAIARRRHYEDTGTLPDAPGTEQETLPDNPLELARRLNSLRVQISQVQALLRDLAALDDSDKKKAGKMDKAEERLRLLKRQKEAVEGKMKVYEESV